MDTPIDPQFPIRLARRLAERFEGNPDTLASVFARYREAEGIDEAGLAAYLGITPDLVPHIALCGRPRVDLFPEDIATVADRFGIEPERLAVLVRHVDALEAFKRVRPERRQGLLAAARDRAAETSISYDTTDHPSANDRPTPARDPGEDGGRR